jgi:PAS domain S-box-containing protein
MANSRWTGTVDFGRFRWPVRYGFALIFVVVAAALNSLPPVRSLPFVFLFGAVALSARVCGFGPAIFATVVSGVIADRFILPPTTEWSTTGSDLLHLLFFAQVSLLISSVAKQTSEAERISQENTSRLAAIVESSEDAIYGKTLEGVVTSWNKGAEQLYGYKPHEILGKSVALLTSPEHPEEVPEILNSLKNGRKIAHRETRRLRKDGTSLDVAISISPIYDGVGKVIGAASIARDITEKKAAEREIQRARLAVDAAEKQTAEILQSIAEGVMVLDRDYTISYINEQGTILTNTTREGILGKNYLEFFPGVKGSNFHENYERAWREQIIRRFEDFYSPLNKWFQVNVYPSQKRLTIFYQDITQRKLAETALRASEQRLLFAQKSANLGSWEWDIKTNVLWWSEGIWHLHGVPVGSVTPSFDAWMDFVIPEDKEKVQNAVNRAVRDGTAYDVEYRCLWPDGVDHWVSARGQVSSDDDGKPSKMVGIGIDITNRKLSEQALTKSEKLAAAGRLAATIAHEINNPLEGITNLLYLLRRNSSLDEKARKYLAMAEQELARVAYISQQTLGFYRDTTSAVSVSLSHTLDEVLSLYLRKIESKEISIEKEFLPGDEVIGSAGEVRQVLSNLVLNALDAMETGGRLRLRVRPSRDYRNPHVWGVRVTIADTGSGIKPALRKRVFEPFFTTKKDLGNGLGLWVSKELVKKHGGSIGVHSSTAPGRSGTVFSVFWSNTAARDYTQDAVATDLAPSGDRTL